MSKAQKDRPRLGRGLSSLIPAAAEVNHDATADPVPTMTAISADRVTTADPIGNPTEVALATISPNPHQPRKQFSDASLGELAASLKSTGMIQPIIVRKVDAGYQLIAGERRWRAATLAGLVTVPILVRDVDAYTQAQMALVENIQREDLNPLDRAQAYHALMAQLGVTQAELAFRLGEDRSSIANHLRLLDLGDIVRSKVADGFLSLGHAKVLAAVADAPEQERLAELCVSQGLSVRNLERILAGGATAAAKPSSPPASAHVQDLEKAITRHLGMRVQLRAGPSGKGRGKLVIHYSSLDEFDHLVERLGVTLE